MQQRSEFESAVLGHGPGSQGDRSTKDPYRSNAGRNPYRATAQIVSAASPGNNSTGSCVDISTLSAELGNANRLRFTEGRGGEDHDFTDLVENEFAWRLDFKAEREQAERLGQQACDIQAVGERLCCPIFDLSLKSLKSLSAQDEESQDPDVPPEKYRERLSGIEEHQSLLKGALVAALAHHLSTVLLAAE